MELTWKHFTALFVVSTCFQISIQAVPQPDTNATVHYDTLVNLKQFNISEVLEGIKKLTLIADEIVQVERRGIGIANYTLIISGSAINDIVGVGNSISCNLKTVNAYVKEYADLIRTAKTEAFAAAPNLTSTSDSVSQSADSVEERLGEQLRQLSEIYSNCPRSLADPELYRCILNQINKFGDYYRAELQSISSYVKSGNEKLRSGWVLVNKWITDTVNPRATQIINKAKPVAERYYVDCNIYGYHMAEFSVKKADSYYEIFNPSITAHVTAINEIVTKVISQNQTLYTPKMRSRMQTAVEPLRTAIAAVLSSPNASQVTTEIRRAPDNIIQNGIRQLNNILDTFNKKIVQLNQEAQGLVQRRLELHDNYTNNLLFLNCFNQSSPFPRVDMSGCSNIRLYIRLYEGANINVISRLEEIHGVLFDNPGASSANEDLLSAMTDSAVSLALRLYKAAGLKVPEDVAARNCLFGFVLPRGDYLCLIVN